MGTIRIAIAGVGNCASSLVQGLTYYHGANGTKPIPGLMHNDLGGYYLSDIKVVCAFDIDKRKVGRDVSEAIFAKPNCTKQFVAQMPNLNAPVYMGPVHDGVAAHMDKYPEEYRFVVGKDKPVDVVKKLKEHKVDVVVTYLPVGSQKAVEHYAKACLEAGVAFINALPVFIVSDKAWAKKFAEKKIPCLGDDIKSQVGATILHRVLTRLFEDRGVKITSTYQLNVGGNTDFLNMLDRSRLASKKISKTEAVRSQMTEPLMDGNIHIGPSDYVPWLKDNKVCFIRIEGKKFGDVPIELEARLSVEDSPNSAGIIVDAIRVAKVALDRGIGGPITSASSYFFKHPPVQYTDGEARAHLEAFISGKESR
ncbi:MAG TPA: inositol-3-phosphate synthase [Candidatus Thermoplasmatota archaeon]|nr:inositol-3-phosphate synthase [Candidatus Thermoplasmatota archaeon]